MTMVSTAASPAPEMTFAHLLTGVAGMFMAALLLAWQPDAVLTRWHPAALAAVHLFALGGLMPVMLGALFQFVPVACGLSLPRWGHLDGWILATLMLGSLTLAGSFLWGSALGFVCAGGLLLSSLLSAGLLGTLASWWNLAWLVSVAISILVAATLVFGVLTAWRVWASKRGERDAFHWGWLGGAVLAVGVAVIGAFAHFSSDARWGVAFGIVALAGFGGGTVSVMLYRIVPFLIWLHWQRVNKARVRLPMLHQIVPERWQRVQLLVEVSAVAVLCGAGFVAALALPGAILLAASKLGQFWLLLRAMRDYRLRRAALKELPARARAAH